MKVIRKTHRPGFRFLASIFLLSLSFQLFSSAEKDVITAIILINRQAELVDMDEEGEILKRHVAIPDYFTSGRSHQSSLRQSLRRIKDYGNVESFILPGSSKLPAVCLQSLMTSLKKKPSQLPTKFSDFIDTTFQFYSNSAKESMIIKDVMFIKSSTEKMAQVTFVPSLADYFYPKANQFRAKLEKQRIVQLKRLRLSDSWFT